MITLVFIVETLGLTLFCSFIAWVAFGVWVDYPTRRGASGAALLALTAVGLLFAGLFLLRAGGTP